MTTWDLRAGFEGTLDELFACMWQFYPDRASILAIQRWLLDRATSDAETLICRNYSGLLRGQWVPGDGATNPFLTSDNEFATSLFGIAWSGDVTKLTRGALLDALAIPKVKLCWALGKNAEQKQAVARSHAVGRMVQLLPTGGTSLYPPRAAQKVKLAHLTPAADAVSALPIGEGERRRLRMFRSLNPLNMFPLPRAGRVFRHRAAWRGQSMPLRQQDLGEEPQILDCLVAFLGQRYEAEGHGEAFATYAKHARLALQAFDVAALRAKSREVIVWIDHLWGVPPAHDVKTYDEFKAWARDIVGRFGNREIDLCVNGEAKGNGGPLVFFNMDGFEDENDDYNRVYRVARDTKVSALAYFLHLDERHHGDQNAIFRPDFSRNQGSLKPLLNYASEDIRNRVIPNLQLYPAVGGEVKGWNVLSRERAR